MDGVIPYMLIVVGMAVLSVASPFSGLIAYMAILYLRPQELIPALQDMNPTRSAALLLLLGVILRGGARAQFPREFRLLLAFLAVLVVSSATTCWVCGEWVVEAMVKNALAFWLIVTLVDSEKRLRVLLWTLLLIQTFMAGDTIAAYLALDENSLGTVRLGAFAQGYFGGAGDFAAMTNILVPFALGFALVARGWRRILPLVVLIVLTGGVVATHARGAGVIALGVSLALSMTLAATSTAGPKRFAPLVLGVLLAAVIGIAAPSTFIDRAASIANYEQEDTAEDRLWFWRIGFRMFKANPVMGVGAGQYSSHFREYGGPRWMGWRVSHNMFVDLASQLGLLGIGAFGVLVGTVVRGLWRVRRRMSAGDAHTRRWGMLSDAALVSVLTYFAAGMFQSILYYPMLYIHLAIAVAIVGLQPAAQAAAVDIEPQRDAYTRWLALRPSWSNSWTR